MLIRYRSSHVQHMQKALHMMNVQLRHRLRQPRPSEAGRVP
jgi:hypothetical protein